MREIKFEFIYSDGKYFTKATMTLEELLNSTEDDIYEKATEQYALYSGLENFELIAKRQYTGLKDSKGVETYEGDIVKYDKVSFVNSVWSNIERTWIVEWDNEWDDFDCALHIGFDFPRDTQEVEVIGNIYENPELLETA